MKETKKDVQRNNETELTEADKLQRKSERESEIKTIAEKAKISKALEAKNGIDAHLEKQWLKNELEYLV
jgi:hypothetical protein